MNLMNAGIGIISGSGFYEFFKGEEVSMETPFGKPSAEILIAQNNGKNIAFLARHGKEHEYPPHKVNYRANIFAFKKLGVKNIFGFYSVGSLCESIKPGEFLVVDDFIGFDIISFLDNKAEHIIPAISQELRQILISSLQKLNLKFHSKGIYFETKGPRLETKAEINLIKNFADVVGMTMQKEAVLSQELGLNYAGLCSVDNFAHGVKGAEPSQKEIDDNKERTSYLLQKIIKEIITKIPGS